MVPESQEWICRKSARKRGLESRNGAGKRRFECLKGTGKRGFECRKGSGKRGVGRQEKSRKAKFGVPKVYQTLRVTGWLSEREVSNAGMVPGREA